MTQGAETAADEPTTGAVGDDGLHHSVEIPLDSGKTGDPAAILGVKGGAQAGVRPQALEAAADHEQVVLNQQGGDVTVRHPEILARDVGERYCKGLVNGLFGIDRFIRERR